MIIDGQSLENIYINELYVVIRNSRIKNLKIVCKNLEVYNSNVEKIEGYVTYARSDNIMLLKELSPLFAVPIGLVHPNYFNESIIVTDIPFKVGHSSHSHIGMTHLELKSKENIISVNKICSDSLSKIIKKYKSNRRNLRIRALLNKTHGKRYSCMSQILYPLT